MSSTSTPVTMLAPYPDLTSSVGPGITPVYFNRQWGNLQQAINQNGTSLQEVISAVDNLPGPYTPPTPTQIDVTGSRTIGGVYQNNTQLMLRVYVTMHAPANSGGTVTAFTDNTATPTAQVGQQSVPGEPTGSSGMVTFEVLPGNYYTLTIDINLTIQRVIECQG